MFAELGIPVMRVRKSIAEELAKREGSNVTINLPIDISSKQCNNVIGVLPGKDTNVTGTLTAHYDHIGDDPKEFGFSGAFDNASGVSVILELVHKFKKEQKTLPFNLLICFLTGEESDFWGAKHLIQHQHLPLSAVINFDVLGLNPELKEVRRGQIDPGHWLSKLTINTLNKYNVISRNHRGNDDSKVFISSGIPTIGFGEYNIHNIGPKIHTPDDNVEAMHYEQLVKVIKIVDSMLDQLSIQS
jgi:Zn-dependent M28 family amino/carboxypeptidase